MGFFPAPGRRLKRENGSSSVSWRWSLAGRSLGISMPSRLPFPLRRTRISAALYRLGASGALSRRTWTCSWRRSTLLMLPIPSGVSTKLSFFGIRLAASS